MDPSTPESFERALGELEQIVQRMESGSLSLEESLGAYRRGASLVAWCRKSLADVQQQVRILEADLLEPFDAGDAASPGDPDSCEPGSARASIGPSERRERPSPSAGR